MKKIGMNKSCTVHNKTTKLAVIVLVEAIMFFLVSMLTEQAYARTAESARSFSSDPPLTNVKWHLNAGRWIETPRVIENGHIIEWVTAGPLPFGGNERVRLQPIWDLIGK
jgi:hypothetical protein